MNATSVFCRGVACACVLGAFVYPALTQGGESSIDTRSPALASTNDLDQGLFPWGDPQYTDGARNLYPRPVWILAACRDGGLWITNDTCYGWQPALGEWQADLATNRLLIQLDRAQAPSNLWLAVVGVGDPEAALLAGFYDNDLLAVAEPLRLLVVDAAPFTNRIDLSRAPTASIIALSVTNGLIRIFRSTLVEEPSRSGVVSPTTSAPPPSAKATNVGASGSASAVMASLGRTAVLAVCALGTLAALIHRGRTNEGLNVDASLLETGVSWMTVFVANFLASGNLPRKLGSAITISRTCGLSP